MKILKKIWKIKNNFVYLHRKGFKYSIVLQKSPLAVMVRRLLIFTDENFKKDLEDKK